MTHRINLQIWFTPLRQDHFNEAIMMASLSPWCVHVMHPPFLLLYCNRRQALCFGLLPALYNTRCSVHVQARAQPVRNKALPQIRGLLPNIPRHRQAYHHSGAALQVVALRLPESMEQQTRGMTSTASRATSALHLPHRLQPAVMMSPMHRAHLAASSPNFMLVAKCQGQVPR